MKKHNHHHCECEHENVKYCKCCKVVYCKDCNKEWKDYSGWTWTYPSYTSPSLYGAASCGTITTTDSNTILCSHKE